MYLHRLGSSCYYETHDFHGTTSRIMKRRGIFSPIKIKVSFPICHFIAMAERRRRNRRDVVQASPAPALAAASEPTVQATKPPTAASWLVQMSRAEYAALAVLETGVVLAYASTLYPSVAGGDSGELVAESCHLGVSHPPGYPLFNMVVHAWMRAVASLNAAAAPAWSANLFSAGMQAAAVVSAVVALELMASG